MVRSLPCCGECSESNDENDDGILGRTRLPGETERDGAMLDGSLRRGGSPWVSVEERVGDEAEGESASSDSETCPLSRDAAKELEMSGSEDTKANEECVEAVEVVEVVLSRPDERDARGSNCHTELAVSTVL